MAYQNILFEGSTVQNLTPDQTVLQMAYLKVWRKRKAEMDLLLHSDTDDDHESQRSVGMGTETRYLIGLGAKL